MRLKKTRIHIRHEIIRPSSLSWSKIRKDLLYLEKEAFGKEKFSERFLKKILEIPRSVTVIQRSKRGRIIGYANAVPLGYEETSRKIKKYKTAYLESIAIRKNYRGKGLVGPLMHLLEKELKRKGYLHIEGHFAVDNGYALKTQAFYEDRIVGKPYLRDSEWGNQLHLRIRL